MVTKCPWGLGVGIAIVIVALTGCDALPPASSSTEAETTGVGTSRDAQNDSRDTAAEPAAQKPAPPEPAPPEPAPTYLVDRVVDGDTIALTNGQEVRLVGIDTPESGDCHSRTAADRLEQLVLGKEVSLTASAKTERDRYGRLLRYVDVGRVDAGLRLIKEGLAIARYDSRDGYGFHAREPMYVRADNSKAQLECEVSKQQIRPVAPHRDCATGYAPCLPVTGDLDCPDVDGPIAVTGADPYRLDADGDGTACEPY